MSRSRSVVAAFLTLALAPLVAAAAGTEPTVLELTLVDGTRATPKVGPDPGAPHRTLVTTVYLPAATAPAPLVLLAHGYDGHPRKFTALAAAWAEAGFVVAVPRFPVTADDAPVTEATFFGERASDVGEQGRDLTFVVAELVARSAAAGDDLAGRIDPERIGFFGLSLGSITVWVALGEGATPVRAVIQSDGAGPPEPWAGPLLVAHSDADPIFPYADTRAALCAQPEPAWLFTVHGTAHAAVAENTPTPADDAFVAATTAFWRQTLADDSTADFPADLPGVTMLERRAEVCAPGSLPDAD